MNNKERCKNCIHKKVCPYQGYYTNVEHLRERCKNYLAKDSRKNPKNEYKVIYRDGDIYKVIDGITNKDSAYMILAMVIKAGYDDSRIAENN